MLTGPSMSTYLEKLRWAYIVPLVHMANLQTIKSHLKSLKPFWLHGLGSGYEGQTLSPRDEFPKRRNSKVQKLIRLGPSLFATRFEELFFVGLHGAINIVIIK